VDKYLIYIAPFIIVGFGIMLAPFLSERWPDWMTNFVVFCAEMSNGVWVAGIASVVLISLSVPVPTAALLSVPVMYFAGRYFARMAERDEERTRQMKLQSWEAHRKREEAQEQASQDPDRRD
jgi:hypothetical protein